jgi:adenylylsulfate kinase
MSVKKELYQYRESRLRSVLKGFSWRILATLTTISIAYLITGQVDEALRIGGYEFFIKMAVYYFHERAWQIIPRGTVRQIIHHEKD